MTDPPQEMNDAGFDQWTERLPSKPRAIAASRPFCEECIKEIESNGGRLVSPTVAIFPLLELRT
jgi:hypothetical protein